MLGSAYTKQIKSKFKIPEQRCTPTCTFLVNHNSAESRQSRKNHLSNPDTIITMVEIPTRTYKSNY